MKRLLLGVNVDHVATIRQARQTQYPDPVVAAAMAEIAGADQITVHLREDRRHIQERDVCMLRQTVQTRLNLEMAATREMQAFALEHKPDRVTLVPEKREELTTEGGLDLLSRIDELKSIVESLEIPGIPVSLFIEPDLNQITAAGEIGAQMIELHTGRYSELRDLKQIEMELERLSNAANKASSMGMKVAAGHGLNYHNVRDVLAVGEIMELNIGHAIVARSLLTGMNEAVREMIALMVR